MQFSMKTTLMIGKQMLNRLRLLHEANILHRDIKPENALIGLDNKSGVIHLIDFGINSLHCQR